MFAVLYQVFIWVRYHDYDITVHRTVYRILSGYYTSTSTVPVKAYRTSTIQVRYVQ